MVKLIWTDEGFSALESIRDYLEIHVSQEVSRRTVREIYQRSEMLQGFPHLGYKLDVKEGIERRVLLYGHYRIMYGVEADRVSVLGVFHTARDIDLSDF